MIIHKTLQEIIDSIIGSMVQNGLVLKKEDLMPGSILLAMVEAVAIDIYDIYVFGDSVDENARPSTATGIFLEYIGSGIGCPRYEGESNESFRYRIANHLRNSRTCSRTAIEAAVKGVSGVYSYYIQNLAYGAGSFVVYIQTTPSADITYVADNVSAAVKDAVADGIYFEVVTPAIIRVDIDMSVIGTSDTNVINSMKTAVANYVASIKPGESLVVNNIILTAVQSSSLIKTVFINSVKINGRTLYAQEIGLLNGEQFKVSAINIVR
jgi:DNA-binding protein